MSTIGKRIKSLRKDNKLTQDRFGELCDVTKSAVSQWEHDTTAPDQSKLSLLRKHLNFSIDYILTGKPDYSAMPAESTFGVKEPAPHHTRPLVQHVCELAERLDDAGLLKLHGYAACLLADHPLVKAKPRSSA